MRPTFIVGEPGAGKTSLLHFILARYVRRDYSRVILVSTIDSRDPPLDVILADSLEEAIVKAKDHVPAVIGYDEINLEVERGKPSKELEAVTRYRRHMKIQLIGTTQRPHDLPPRVRDLDVNWRLMRWTDTGAYAWGWIQKRFPRQCDKLPHLEPYYFEIAGKPARAGRHYVIGR